HRRGRRRLHGEELVDRRREVATVEVERSPVGVATEERADRLRQRLLVGERRFRVARFVVVAVVVRRLFRLFLFRCVVVIVIVVRRLFRFLLVGLVGFLRLRFVGLVRRWRRRLGALIATDGE